jgi:hypothetical protein
LQKLCNALASWSLLFFEVIQLVLISEKKAVSEPEIMAENNNKTAIIIRLMATSDDNG